MKDGKNFKEETSRLRLIGCRSMTKGRHHVQDMCIYVIAFLRERLVTTSIFSLKSKLGENVYILYNDGYNGSSARI